MPSESPTRIRSAPLASNTRAKPASYAVSIARRRPARRASARAGTVIGLSAALFMGLGYRLDAIGIQCRQRGAHAAVAGDHRIRCDLGQRHQCERALMQVWMGQLQARRVDNRVAMEQQVEVERARAPAAAAVGRALTPEAL